MDNSTSNLASLGENIIETEIRDKRWLIRDG
jgi:hypothetical protein